MLSVLLAVISGAVQLALLYIKRRFDLKEIEAGRKKAKDGRLIDTGNGSQSDDQENQNQ